MCSSDLSFRAHRDHRTPRMGGFFWPFPIVMSTLRLGRGMALFPPELSLVTTTADSATPFAVRRLNRLAAALSCRTYLEIGVSKGKTFLGVNVASRVGVDPQFRFDWSSYHGKDGIQLHQCPSDEFFAFIDPATTYDLIFVDGLHTFEQTYRDILHALRHSHPGTVIAIDDTIPCDVFSTSRSLDECVEMRRSITGVVELSWHGDTYKVIPLLSVFNSDLRLITLIDGGNPWTLIWRPSIPVAADELRIMQALWAVQNLAAADYLWFLSNLSLYSPVSEADGLDEVIRSLRAPLP